MNYYLKLISIVCLAMLVTATGLHAGEIHEAVAAGDLAKVRALIEADPKLLESRDNVDHTPLHIACWKKQLAIAIFLIDKGANVNARNEYGLTVLSCAIDDQDRDEWFDVVKRLIDKGADLNAKNSAEGSLLHTAANKGNIRVAGLLIDNGADLNAPGQYGTPLQSNIIFWPFPHEEMAIFLVEKGVKPQEYSFGNNDLHLAAIRGYAGLVQAMVTQGFDINVVNDYGHTPLYYAARHGYRRAADVLIAAGADEGTIEETNYGKASQLTETLKEGEAYLWYLGGMAPGTGYAVKTKNNLLIFDPYKIDNSPEAGLANGHVNPDELAGQKITILLTRKEPHPFNPTVSDLAKRLSGADFILSFKPTADNMDNANIPAYRFATANESFSVGGMQIHTIQTRPSTLSSTGNLGYLVEVDGVKVFHAGLHRPNGQASQIENYHKEIDILKSFGPIDFAILPFGHHHLGNIDYKQYLYLIDQLKPKAIYLIGDDSPYEEHRKCLEVLSARDILVEYPDGGIAMGERFHYLTPDTQEFTDLYGDYLGQTPPGDTPVVFARGVVSTDLLEHSAPAFSPDGNEVFWWLNRPPRSENEKWDAWGMTMKRIGGRWTVQKVTSLISSEPVFSPDGKRLYFSLFDFSIPNSISAEPYFIEKQGNSWSKPKSPGITDRFPELQYAGSLSITSNGTLYFLGTNEELGVRYNYAIYRTKLINGEYAQPELLPRSINLPPFQNWTPFIAPDESYLIFSSDRTGQLGEGDLYISFHDVSSDTWSEPVNMGAPINTRAQERLPGVSPDGKYLFFTRYNPPHNQDIFWVSAKIIEKLKAKAVQALHLKQ